MGKIRIIGLGSGGENSLTKEAMEYMADEWPNYIRTKYHESLRYFDRHGIPYESFDEYYEKFETFEEIYRQIAEDLMIRAEDENINYFVPGHPLIAEKTVQFIIESGVSYEIINGMSFIEPVLSAVHADPVEGLRIINGDEFSDLEFDIHINSIIVQVYNERIASELKLIIGELYGDEHEIVLISHGGIPEREVVHKIPIYQLDQEELTYETSIFVPAVESETRYNLTDVFRITRRLRGENGCSWDQVQTHESMKENLIEEAYEVLQAIEDEDIEGFSEELGDLLFQIVFHSEIAREEGDFTFLDITSSISEKLIRRHPHVFADGEADWEGLKAKEREDNSLESRLEHVINLPALLAGEKIVKILKNEDKSLLNGYSLKEIIHWSEEEFGKFLLYWIQEAEKHGIKAETALKINLLQILQQVKS